MLRRVALTGALLLVLAPSASAATRYVAANGNDGAACTQAAPCQTLARGYAVAAASEVVEVAAGSYPKQSVPTGSKAVTFKGKPGNTLYQLANEADNVTFDGINVDAQATRPPDDWSFASDGAANVTFKNGSIGNIEDGKGSLVSGPNFMFDNVYFHDVVLRTSGVHLECIFAIGVEGMTVRNSHFHNCAIMDLFFEWGAWWTPQPPAYNHVTIENNVFEHVLNDNMDSWNYYPLYIGRTGSTTLDGWIVRNNTFEQNAMIGATHDNAVNSIWANNIGGWNCLAGMTFRNNVGQKCDPSDKQVSPNQNSETSLAPFG
jgi:hypothetical protein